MDGVGWLEFQVDAPGVIVYDDRPLSPGTRKPTPDGETAISASL